MFVRSDIIIYNSLRRWCIFFGQNSHTLSALNRRKYFYCKKLGKHVLGCRFSLSLCPWKRLLTCMSSDSKHEPDTDGSGKDVFDSSDFYENSLRDVSEARQLLYPSSDHPIVKLLNSSASVQDVFDVVRNNEVNIDACSLGQAVLVLWDLQKVFYEVNIKNYSGGVEGYSVTHSEDVFRNYVNQIRTHPSFEHLLDLVGQHVHEFSMDAMTCMLLYLRKMSVEMHNAVMHTLLLRSLSVLKENGEEVSMLALSQFIAATQDPGLWALCVMKDAIPILFQRMETCENAADFQLLTTSLIGSHRLLDVQRLEVYKRLVERLVAQGKLTGQHSRAVLKAAYLLNYPPWSQCNCTTVRHLLLLLVGRVHSLLAPDLVHLHRMFTSQLEPAELLEEMRSHASHLLDNADQFDRTHLPSQCELLECIVTFSLPSQKHVFERLALEHLSDSSFASSVTPLFKILRYLKTSDIRLCDRFWALVIKFLQEHEDEREDFKLLKICYRYMHFNSHVGGTYRHIQFESHMLQWLWEHVSCGITGLVPSKFSQVASFVLAYAGGQSTGHEQLLSLVMHKLPDMLPQFSEIDCLNMSRGLQVGMRLQRQGWRRNPQLLWDLASVNSALDHWSLDRMRQPMILRDINLLMKAYMCRRGASNTELFHQLIRSYENSSEELSSRLIRSISMNLLMSRCLLPQTIDRMVEYSVVNSNHILGETVEKLLNLCYCVGYCPAPQDRFLSSATQVLLRDKEHMSGMALLQCALSLCFFQHLPQELIFFIFTVDFMERLDQEIAQCYSKATYPTRVRSYLMQLNRAVCLDCPEASVPWFHEKYVQQIAAQEPFPTSSFFLDVQKAITTVVGGKEFVRSNVYSPYGYNIDFQVMVGADKQPLSESNVSGGNITRVAVLLHNGWDYSVHEHQLGGRAQLKQRHLELLGYKVLGISESLWHSMYMSEPQAKQIFLQDQLFN